VNISDIQQLIMARLQSEIQYLKKVAPVAEFFVETAGERTISAPAVYVAYQEGRYDIPGTGNPLVLDHSLTFMLIVVHRSFVSHEQLLQGKDDKKGIYDVLDDVRQALSGYTLSESMDPMMPILERAIAGDDSLAVFSIFFETRHRIFQEYQS
jgi:hypothetical protein